MNDLVVGYIGLALMFILLFSGMPIGIVMGIVGFAGMVLLTNFGGGIALLGTVPYRTWSSYDFSIAPMFILMGSLCFYAGISQSLYRAVHNWIGHLPGGLAMATVGACAGFAAISGSSLATAATMGTVALPEMKKYGYKSSLATGCIAAGGTMGILIPPSVPMVIYAILTQQSIGQLFLAGFIPGILQAIFYIIVIYVICKRNPNMGPRGPQTSLMTKISSLKDTGPVLILFILVIGGIYTGIFTVNEAAGIGAFVALLITIFTKKFTLKNFKASLFETSQTTAMMFILLLGAMIFSYFLATSKLPMALSTFLSELPVNRWIILILIVIIYLFLGCVIDTMAMLLLTVPIFFPVIQALDFNPIWFGIIVVRMMEIGMITPPVGMNVFVIKGIATDVPMSTIFKGVMPFFAADILHVALLMAVPAISLVLPDMMM
jgi:C4-dicarboxylate transporter DctM subunit